MQKWAISQVVESRKNGKVYRLPKDAKEEIFRTYDVNSVDSVLIEAHEWGKKDKNEQILYIVPSIVHDGHKELEHYF